jgi:hypothetical protein
MMTVKCPRCGNTFEITEALKKQLEEQTIAKQKEKLLIEVEKAKKETEEKTILEIKILKEQLELEKKQADEARKIELDLRKKANLLEEEKRAFELTKQRQIDAEREEIRQKATREVLELHKLKDKEKEKIIEDLKKSLGEAQRKATQGSQQLQGEVQELDLEETLRAAFPSDIIEPVEKGIRGADIRQIVRTVRGNTCGVILWESKRTKAWSDDWLVKLKDDLRNEKANIPVILSSVLPKSVGSGLGLVEGVWVADYSLLLPLSEILRQKLIEVAREKFFSQNKGEKAELVYQYVTSHEFQQQVEAIIEVYQEMQVQILKEKAAFEKIWKIRETQVQRLLGSTSKIYGSMQGRIGPTLPQIKGLDLLELAEGNREDKNE